MFEHPSIKRVGVCVKPHLAEANETVGRLLVWLGERGIALAACPDVVDQTHVETSTGYPLEVYPAEQLAAECDLMVVLGGDGTMIGTARLMGDYDIPVLGINYGTLGYLAEFRVEEMFPALEAILAGDYSVEERVRLSVELVRGETLLLHSRALNEIVVNKAALARIIELEAYMNQQLISAFRADGVIFSTPTGSTAYNLSAGGPVVYPSMNAIVITPICPFTLSDRPIVVPDEAQIEVFLKTRSEEVFMTLDGQIGHALEAGDRIIIRKSRTTFKIIQPSNRNYFEVLREKLRWGK